MVENRCITAIREIKFAFAWTITDFTVRVDAKMLFLESLTYTFESQDVEWRLEIDPQGYTGHHYLDVSLKLVNCSEDEAPTKFEISILNGKNEKTHIRRYSDGEFKIFTWFKDASYKFENYISLGVLLDRENGLCLLYTSPSPRDRTRSRMPSSA